MRKAIATITGMALAVAMAAFSPAAAGWDSWKGNAGKALGDKDCWAKAFSFQLAKKDKCKRDR